MVKGLFEDHYLPIVGQVKIGEKGEEKTSARGNKFRAPVQLPYFLITTLEKEDNSVVPDMEMMEYYGAEFDDDGNLLQGPTRLPIALPFPKFTDSFETFYAQYDKNQLLCRSDGETAIMLDKKTNEYVEMACNPDICQNFKNGQCKLHGNLHFYFRTGENLGDVQVGGVYVFKTTSMSTIYSLNDSAYDIARVLGDDNLASVPLWLVYGRKTINTSGGIRTVPAITLRYGCPDFFTLGRALKSPVVAVKDDEEPVEEEDASGTSVLEEQLKALEENPEEAPAGEPESGEAFAAARTHKKKGTGKGSSKKAGLLLPAEESGAENDNPGAGSIPPF